jgi:adenine deaminase
MERLRLGFYVMIREGSIRRDLEAISGIKEQDIDFRRLCLATDSVSAEDLLSLGHMDFVVQKAINLGIDPIKVFQMASLNTAEHFRKDHVTGGIAPGRCADIVILPSLKKIECETVISNGQIVARNGQVLVHARKGAYPESVLNSIRVSRALQPRQFDVPAGDKKSKVTVRVMKLISELITREFHAVLPVVNGCVLPDPDNDILKVSLVERLRDTGRIVTGFVQGFGLRSGAVACSYSWDLGSPLAVVGANDLDMATAVNRIVTLQGGIVVVDKGRILAEVPQPVGGLLPVNKIEETAQEFKNINQAVKQLGSLLTNPYMTLQTIAGTSLPFFRICLQGFVDLRDQKIVDLFVD